MEKNFWQGKQLSDFTDEEWEALCDGCGLCCVHKLDRGNGLMSFTNIACHMLDDHSCQCKDYNNRKSVVPDCVQLQPSSVGLIDWLPPTCTYRLIEEGKPLPEWHYLLSGSRDTVHQVGISVRGKIVSERNLTQTLLTAMADPCHLLYHSKKKKISWLKKSLAALNIG